MKISIIVYSDHGTLYSNEKEIKYSPTKPYLDLLDITLNGRSQAKMYILYNLVYLKFKNRQHLFTVMKVRIKVTWDCLDCQGKR